MEAPGDDTRPPQIHPAVGLVMSALPPKADIGEHDRDVRFVPKTDIVIKTGRLVRCAYGTSP
jgi:hypothetical protein